MCGINGPSMKSIRWLRVVLLAVGSLVATENLPESAEVKGSDLDCTNDYEERMFCQFEAQNCAQHNLTLSSNSGYGEGRGVFQACEDRPGRCCSTVPKVGDMLIIYSTITATVWQNGSVVQTKLVPVTESIKPKAPTIVSVRESNGNIELKWRTSYTGQYVDSALAANVTYYKKGQTEKVTVFDKLVSKDGLKYYQIPGQELEPSTTYVVSVRSYLSWSGKYSDSSQEQEFTTGVSPNTVILVIILSLSVLAIIATAIIFGCFVTLKKKWWDTTTRPEILIHPCRTEFLKPDPLIMSPVNIMPPAPKDSESCMKFLLMDTSSESTRQSSGISTGSSGLSYANTEPVDIRAGVQDALQRAFPTIGPASPVTRCQILDTKDSDFPSSNSCGFTALDTSSGSSGFDNRTYSVLVPSDPQQFAADGSEAQSQTAVTCISPYHPSEGDTAACPEQQVPACPLFSLPLLASSLIPTDMSYHQCRADSAYAEDSSLSSASSSSTAAASYDLASRADPCYEADGGEADLSATKAEGLVCDENPCYGRVPAVPRGFPLVVDDYQAFQSLVREPEVLFPAQMAAGKRGPLDPFPEGSFAKIPAMVPAFINSVPRGLPEPNRPTISLMSSHVPVITNTDYQSV